MPATAVFGDTSAARAGAETLPGLQRAIKWGIAYYGVDGGWCFTSGAFVGHVKLMFIRGAELTPEPPVTPIGMAKPRAASSRHRSANSTNVKRRRG